MVLRVSHPPKRTATPSYEAVDITDPFHNGNQIQHAFVLMLISLSSLAAMSKIQMNS